jgi:hypothetical protein
LETLRQAVLGHSLIGDHDAPHMVGKAAFQAAFGFPWCLPFGEFPLVVGMPWGLRRPDLSDGDGVENGVELTVAGA